MKFTPLPVTVMTNVNKEPSNPLVPGSLHTFALNQGSLHCNEEFWEHLVKQETRDGEIDETSEHFFFDIPMDDIN